MRNICQYNRSRRKDNRTTVSTTFAKMKNRTQMGKEEKFAIAMHIQN